MLNEGRPVHINIFCFRENTKAIGFEEFIIIKGGLTTKFCSSL
jgi:hypothetical protein